MFIVFEGIDGSGKSTVSRLVAERTGGVYYSTPPEKYRQLRKTVDTSSDLQRHYEFYRDAVIEASGELEAIESANKIVVCDRYWLSTLVYHRAGNLVLDGSDFVRLKRPDLTVFLYVSPSEQSRRSQERGGKEVGNIEGFQSVLSRLYYEALTEFGLSFISLNTDHFSPEECAEIVCAAVKK
jgi:thymidylate kinase